VNPADALVSAYLRANASPDATSTAVVLRNRLAALLAVPGSDVAAMPDATLLALVRAVPAATLEAEARSWSTRMAESIRLRRSLTGTGTLTTTHVDVLREIGRIVGSVLREAGSALGSGVSGFLGSLGLPGLLLLVGGIYLLTRKGS